MEGFFSSMAAAHHAANLGQNGGPNYNHHNNHATTTQNSSNARSSHNNAESGGKQFKCDFCDKSFTQRRNQRAHIRTVHEKLKPFQCTHCGLTANRKFNLLSHIKKMHGSALSADSAGAVIDTRLSGAISNTSGASQSVAKKSAAAQPSAAKSAENVQQLCLVCSAPVKTANKYFCDKCDQRFTAPPSASSGMSSYLSNVQGRNFQQPTHRQFHQNLPNNGHGHSGGSGNQFRCLQCPFFTDDSSAMIGHHLHAHSSYPMPM